MTRTGVRKKGRKRERVRRVGRGRERGRKLLMKKTTGAFAGSRDKKGQGGLLTRRDRTRTRTTVCDKQEGERERELGRRAR